MGDSPSATRPSGARRRGPLLLVLLLAACSSAAHVKTKSTTELDVSAYHTYEWATPAPVYIADEERERDAAVLEWTIRNAIGQQLAAKGYSSADGASPDFLVDFGVRLEEKSTDTFGQYITYRERGGHQDMGPAFVFGYEEGTLLIEVRDGRSHARAWSGSGRTVLDDGQDVTKLEASVGRILASFPAVGGRVPPTTAKTNGAGDFRPPEP